MDTIIVLCSFLVAFVGLYWIPAVAFFPQLLNSPRTTTAIPILSILFIYTSKEILTLLDIYSPTTVRSLLIGLAIIAFTRMVHFNKNELHYRCWTKQETYLAVINGIISTVFIFQLGDSGFDTHDEICSWNYWANQHFFNDKIDYSMQGGAYPQMLPIIISYGYQLLGDNSLEIPIKSSLFIFSWVTLNAIGFSRKGITTPSLWLWTIFCLAILFAMNLQDVFKRGYADGLMVGCLSSSIMFALNYRQNKRYAFLALSSLCAIAAILSKQAAILWAFFALPVYYLLGKPNYKNNPSELLWIILPILSVILWILTEGSEFYKNTGPIQASINDRTWIEQIIFSSNKLLIGNPLFLIIYAASIYFACKFKDARHLLLLFLIPSTILWLLFGAYSIRLGAHCYAVAAIIVWGYIKLDDIIDFAKTHTSHNLKKIHVSHIPIALFIGASINAATVIITNSLDSNLLINGPKKNLKKYFPKHYLEIHDDVFKSSTPIKLLTNYCHMYAFFYPGNHIRILGNSIPNPTEALKKISSENIEYIFINGYKNSTSSDTHLNAAINDLCPKGFQQVAHPNGSIVKTLYKANNDILKKCIKNGS